MKTNRAKKRPTKEQLASLQKAADDARERVSRRNAISRLAPASWLDALIESYERNISIHKTEYEHTGNKYYEGAADAYRDVLNDLRAERRSASNGGDQAAAPESGAWPQPKRKLNMPRSKTKPHSEVEPASTGSETPIYCGGGCKGIVGYVPKGGRMLHYPHIRYAHWCVKCAAADRAKSPNGLISCGANKKE